MVSTMTIDEADPPTDRLYNAIAALSGWDEAINRATMFGPQENARRLGQVLSTILLAAGEDNAPVAVVGELDDDGTGDLSVVYDELLVAVEATTIWSDRGSFTATLHGFNNVSALRVSSAHNYFEGVSTRRGARHYGLWFTAEIDGRQFVFRSARLRQHPLVADDAILSAYEHIRDRGIVNRP
jgi:hypothetical protein